MCTTRFFIPIALVSILSCVNEIPGQPVECWTHSVVESNSKMTHLWLSAHLVPTSIGENPGLTLQIEAIPIGIVYKRPGNPAMRRTINLLRDK